MGKEAIEDQGIYRDNGGWSENHVDAKPEDGDAFLDGEGIVEGIVLERKVLMERRDLVDGSEEADE